MTKSENVLSQWLHEHGASDVDRAALQALLHICEFSGPDALSYCTEDFGDSFFGISSKRKGGLHVCAVFHRATFTESEITFLAAAEWIGKSLKPHYVKGIAEENLYELRCEPKRRRRERID